MSDKIAMAVTRERVWRKPRVEHIRVPGHHNWKKGTEHINGLKLFFKNRDQLSESGTLNPNGTKTHFAFELTRSEPDRH